MPKRLPGRCSPGLSLDGTLKPVGRAADGGARGKGCGGLLPAANAAEAAVVEGVG
ncbi:MAG: hypothetical protein ACLRMJ_02425 [Alistipes finegoldii]